jgi:hypothetical protein
MLVQKRYLKSSGNIKILTRKRCVSLDLLEFLDFNLFSLLYVLFYLLCLNLVE